MTATMRQSTLETLGLGTAIAFFQQGKLPVSTSDLVDTVFGVGVDRGSLVISGANGTVGAGKTLQLGSRLEPYNVPIVGLDFPGSPNAIHKKYTSLVSAFGPDTAQSIVSNIIQLSYNGKQVPAQLNQMKPKFLLEAIPEILELKKAHYQLFQSEFPNLDIRSVTSGFPSSELGVGIAHPAFPHEINKVWEIVENQPSAITQLLWSLGMIPVPVGDHWSFILDVLFCGITLAALRYHEAHNMPYWKIDKYMRKHFGPNPFRAHDAIGAKGANFLTWSCLHHLSQNYGDLYLPTHDLSERKDSGQNWYPPNHFRPLVNWTLDETEEDHFLNWTQGALFQMTSMMLHENRGHLTHMNSIGELCAQFRNGALASMRKAGADQVIQRVESYHKVHPAAAKSAWYPDSFGAMDTPDWQQLYVNAEHDGTIGVITIGRESYNSDVDQELNRAIDWLKTEAIERVIIAGDFHLSTQMLGADTSEFFQALGNREAGFTISNNWSTTARRLHNEFAVSVGCITGKRCLGGFLELMVHCHYFVSLDTTSIGMPEVTLPVIPGMEGCHWIFRKCSQDDWDKLLQLLLSGKSIQAKNTIGWLTDFAGSMEDTLQIAWQLASGGQTSIKKRKVTVGALKHIPELGRLSFSEQDESYNAKKAVFDTIIHACSVPLDEALEIQANHSADFMISEACRKGMVGSEKEKTINV